MTESSALDPEDRKIVTLARSARARNAVPEGAAVRDDTGRTYVAGTVDLASLKLSALRTAVAMAVASGAASLEAAAVVGEAASVPAEDLAAVADLGGADTPVLLAGWTARSVRPSPRAAPRADRQKKAGAARRRPGPPEEGRSRPKNTDRKVGWNSTLLGRGTRASMNAYVPTTRQIRTAVRRVRTRPTGLPFVGAPSDHPTRHVRRAQQEGKRIPMRAKRTATGAALAAGALAVTGLALAPSAAAVTPQSATITASCGIFGGGSATLTATQSAPRPP